MEIIMKRLLLFLSLLSLIPGIKGQETPGYGFGFPNPFSDADLAMLIAAGYIPETGQFVQPAVAQEAPILYQCPQCVQIFNTQNELDQHERDHLLFAGLDIDDIDLSAFDEPLSSFNNSVSAHQVFASPAAPAHASPTAQIPVIDQTITKGSIEPQKNQLLLPTVYKSQSFQLAPINTDDMKKLTVEEQFRKIEADARRAQKKRSQEKRAAALSATMAMIPSQNDIIEEEEETGDDKSYSADPEYQDDDDQQIATIKHTHKKSFQCSDCGKILTQISNCLKHIQSQHNGNAKVIEIGETTSSTHQCLFPECTRSFASKFSLEQHQRKTHGKTLYDGNQVPSETLQPLKNENGSWDCPYQNIEDPSKRCPYREQYLTRIIQHLPVHTGTKNFQCSECKKFFTQNSGCLKHIQKHHNGGNAEVLTKDSSADETQSLTMSQPSLINSTFQGDFNSNPGQGFTDTHQGQTVQGLPPLILPTNPEALALAPTHTDYAEGLIAGSAATLTKKKSSTIHYENVCGECGKSFRWPALLQQHIAQKHSSERNHPCTFPGCEKRFADKQALNSHKKIHDPKQCLPCPYEGCKQLSKNQSTLVKHIRTHTGEKPFGCPYCDYRAAQKNNVTTHIRKDHPGKEVVVIELQETTEHESTKSDEDEL